LIAEELTQRLVQGSDDGPRLRRLIVGLALAGRLGEVEDAAMDVRDVEAALLEGAEVGSSRGRRNRRSRELAKPPMGLGTEHIYFRLADVARVEKGRTPIKHARPGPFPLVVTAEARGACDHCDFDEAAALVPMVSSTGHGHASIRRLHYQEGEFAAGTILAVITPHRPDLISARFIFEYLTAFKEELLVSQMLGTANVSLTLGKIGDVAIPFVPPRTQARMDEVMATCAALEARQQEQERCRDELASATAHAVCASVSERGVREAAGFYVEQLPRLCTRPSLVAHLRRTLQDLAVLGHIATPVNTEARASEISRIAVAGSVEPNGPPIPEHWDVVTLRDVTSKISDGAHKTPTYVASGVPFVSTQDFSGGALILDGARRIPMDEHRRLYARCDPKRGDILIGRIGTLGKPVVVETDEEFSVFVSVGLLRVVPSTITPQYLRLFLMSSLATKEFDRIKVGGGTHTNKLNLRDLATISLPLPPLAEQQQIVATVGELLSVCDRLEESLANRDSARSDLLDAMLREVLAGNGI
jgi:type I restriction enzyme S subunit